MDFKEFLLLEQGERVQRQRPGEPGADPTRQGGGRPGDRPPKPTRMARAITLGRKVWHGLQGAKAAWKKGRGAAGNLGHLQVASTNITNPTLKRLSEIVAATEVTPGKASSTQAAIGMRKLTRKLRTGTSQQRAGMRGQPAGSAHGAATQ